MTAAAAVAGPGVPTRRAGRPRALWALVALVVALALAGAGVCVALLRSPDLGPAAIGSPVRTSFGTFTVTNASTTFVPDTQGPPNQHSGTTGNDQLQVWVRLANSRGKHAVAYSPSQFRLVGTSGDPRRPDGSTLVAATLAPGSSIDGQVWFDLAKGQRLGGRQWLEYARPGGHPIRVPLSQAPPAPTPQPHHHAG